MIEVYLTGPTRTLALDEGYTFEINERNNLFVYTEHDNCILTVRDGFWSHVRDHDPDVAETE